MCTGAGGERPGVAKVNGLRAEAAEGDAGACATNSCATF